MSSILRLLLFPLFLILIHRLVLRWSSTKGQSAALVAILTATFLAQAGDLYNRSSGHFIEWAILRLTIGYCYFHLFNMSETARRIKILLQIYRQKSLEKSQLSSLYRDDLLIPVRMQRLEALKQVHLENGKYILVSQILYYPARIMYFWRKILGFS